MKKMIMLAILLSVATLGVAQEKETRKLDDFSSIEVGEAIELIITQGDKNEAVIEVDDIDLDDVITEVRGSELNIERKNSNRNNSNNRGEVVVRLTYKEIDEISVNSAASVFSKSIIKAKEFELNASSAGQMELELEVEELQVEVSSAGNVEVAGTCSSLDLEVSSAGRYEGYDLVCTTIKAEASSGGSGEVFVKNRLDADAGSGGAIYYKGDPDKVLADSNLGGRIQKR
ncbi:MAG: head GIN domain-containing protein [Reichenbachiella sp.]|uniref:head GIN domain-containing protein n=1 Tax=Reichenbachiella sp. TaxID=2184521 RepID=UPI00296769F7|nr:head GIN domain-containing protein [Reichenbachiella sp.]MDW3210834.1 head GIN domain-containing protein [Reichenbachiella sp.]